MEKKSFLPLPSQWPDEDTYVNSMLAFAANTELFRNLCGGIHILDFLTREPDLYSTVLPEDWRYWFEYTTTQDLLDLLLREDLAVFDTAQTWRDIPRPPQSLLDYIATVRGYSLLRTPVRDDRDGLLPMPRHIAVGMKPKKIHEVENFASYVNKLTEKSSQDFESPITDIVDFGSGQNYLGRTLASPPYNKHVIAIERRHHVVEGARGMDVHAKIAKKEKIMRNKKEWKRLQQEGAVTPEPPTEPSEQAGTPEQVPVLDRVAEVILEDGSTAVVATDEDNGARSGKGRITYIEHDIKDGYLEEILHPKCPPVDSAHIDAKETSGGFHGAAIPHGRMVISLHSCGNLVHHGLRSLVLNPSVSAVAMIGCCYNLMTERLGPATYKLPVLRPHHPRLEATSSAHDPHGFPMSQYLENFQHEEGSGIRANITARMMAVQAPYNWGHEDSEAFFSRHYYRALLQRILLDVGVVDKPAGEEGLASGAQNEIKAAGTPLIVGSLRKAAFVSFHSYARAALQKLSEDSTYGALVKEKTAGISDETLSRYERDYGGHRKRLATIWSLMAFSAGVVESIIAVDRWLYLREQDCIEACWVEPVFDYAQSPRNLVVVGIKKRDWNEERVR